MLAEPCHCGRNHFAIQTRSEMGEEKHCPMTWWGWLRILSPSGESFEESCPMSKFVIPASVLVNHPLMPKGLSLDEQDRWKEAILQKAQYALEELRKVSPGVAQALADLVDAKRARRISDWRRISDMMHSKGLLLTDERRKDELGDPTRPASTSSTSPGLAGSHSERDTSRGAPEVDRVYAKALPGGTEGTGRVSPRARQSSSRGSEKEKEESTSESRKRALRL